MIMMMMGCSSIKLNKINIIQLDYQKHQSIISILNDDLSLNNKITLNNKVLMNYSSSIINEKKSFISLNTTNKFTNELLSYDKTTNKTDVISLSDENPSIFSKFNNKIYYTSNFINGQNKLLSYDLTTKKTEIIIIKKLLIEKMISDNNYLYLISTALVNNESTFIKMDKNNKIIKTIILKQPLTSNSQPLISNNKIYLFTHSNNNNHYLNIIDDNLNIIDHIQYPDQYPYQMIMNNKQLIISNTEILNHEPIKPLLYLYQNHQFKPIKLAENIYDMKLVNQKLYLLGESVLYLYDYDNLKKINQYKLPANLISSSLLLD
jgi:hypothetical protein